MKSNLKVVSSNLRNIKCFNCSDEPHLLLYKKGIKEKSKKEEWKERERFQCNECGHTFWFDGEELVMEPCGHCEENAWVYINSLQNPGYLNSSGDRVRCHVCGKLFRLRNNKLVHAPIDFSFYNSKS